MTSIEFVIWMRGFMACHNEGCIMQAREAGAVRSMLKQVDGVPLMPVEQQTVLSPPVPFLVPSTTPVDPLSPPWEVTCVDVVTGDAPTSTVTNVRG
jgi:hypothetical protein